jgi:hypothetical protein
MSKPRNLKVDLEICNRASKAPWRVVTNKHPTTSGNSWGWVEGTRENWCWSNDNKKSYADARFIAQAREGWPHAIERAMKAEALVLELREALNKIAYPVRYLQNEADEKNFSLDGRVATELANSPHWLKSIAKEVLGDEA